MNQTPKINTKNNPSGIVPRSPQLIISTKLITYNFLKSSNRPTFSVSKFYGKTISLSEMNRKNILKPLCLENNCFCEKKNIRCAVNRKKYFDSENECSDPLPVYCTNR